MAVVSQRPGSWGERRCGRVEIEVGTGIWRESERVGVRLIWAIREVDMLLYRLEMALARLDCEKRL